MYFFSAANERFSTSTGGIAARKGSCRSHHKASKGSSPADLATTHIRIRQSNSRALVLISEVRRLHHDCTPVTRMPPAEGEREAHNIVRESQPLSPPLKPRRSLLPYLSC
jgi:hypothetical protein